MAMLALRLASEALRGRPAIDCRWAAAASAAARTAAICVAGGGEAFVVGDRRGPRSAATRLRLVADFVADLRDPLGEGAVGFLDHPQVVGPGGQFLDSSPEPRMRLAVLGVPLS